MLQCSWCHSLTTPDEAAQRKFNTGQCVCGGPLCVVPPTFCCQAGYEASPEPCPWHGRGNVTHTRDGF